MGLKTRLERELDVDADVNRLEAPVVEAVDATEQDERRGESRGVRWAFGSQHCTTISGIWN